MKIREVSEMNLIKWMTENASLSSLQLPELAVLKKLCGFLRINFGGLDEQDLNKAFIMYMTGDLPNVKRRGNQLDAYLLGQILGEYRRGSNGVYGNEDEKGDRLERANAFLAEQNENHSNEFVSLLKSSNKPQWKRIRRICREGRNFTYSEIIANLEAHRMGATFGKWENDNQDKRGLILNQIS